jgi:YjbE family integral membrane protein
MDHASSLDLIGPIVEIAAIDLLLSGDNAVVIALACRGLPRTIWRQVVGLGTAAAVVLRIALTAFAALLLNVPYLKLIGAVLLVAIAIRLIAGEPHRHPVPQEGGQPHDLWKALTTILVADTVMSADNVLAVAAAARGSYLLLAFGLVLSVPILIFASVMVTRALERYPVLIVAGGALLGWVAGDIAVSDPAIKEWIDTQSFGLAALAPLIGAAYVVVQARLARRAHTPEAVPVLRPVPAAVVSAPVVPVPVAPPPAPRRPHPVSSIPEAVASPLDAAQQAPPVSNRRIDLIIAAAILVPLFAIITAVYFVAWSIRHH